MADRTAVFRYAYLGLQLRSTIALPDFAAWDGEEDGADGVALIEAPTPTALDDCVLATPLVQIDRAGRALFTLDAIGRFLIVDGTRILFTRSGDVLPGEISTFLLATVGGIVLLQRGFLTLHASAVAIDGRAALISGPSGAGKSTLAGALVGRGHALLADDVCALEMAGGQYHVRPSRTPLKLGPDSLAALGFAASAGELVRRGQVKRRVPPSRIEVVATPVAGVFRLSVLGGAKGSAIVDALAGFARLSAPSDLLFKPRLGEALGRREQNFTALGALASQVAFYRVTRPHGFDSLDRIVRDIEAAIGRG